MVFHRQHKLQFFRLLLTLMVLWLLLSGMFKPLLLILGVMSIAIVLYFSVVMKLLTHCGRALFLKPFHLLCYFGWLMVEILKSNLVVIKDIFSPTLTIDPLLKVIPSTQTSEMGRVIYANSITLTPGTIAISILQNGDILVHALNRASFKDLENGPMDAKVCALEPDVHCVEDTDAGKDSNAVNKAPS